jgi:hypothetical protein
MRCREVHSRGLGLGLSPTNAYPVRVESRSDSFFCLTSLSSFCQHTFLSSPTIYRSGTCSSPKTAIDAGRITLFSLRSAQLCIPSLELHGSAMVAFTFSVIHCILSNMPQQCMTGNAHFRASAGRFMQLTSPSSFSDEDRHWHRSMPQIHL